MSVAAQQNLTLAQVELIERCLRGGGTIEGTAYIAECTEDEVRTVAETLGTGEAA